MRTSGQILCAVTREVGERLAGQRGAGKRLAAALEDGFDRGDHAVAGERLREPRPWPACAATPTPSSPNWVVTVAEHVEPERRAALDLRFESAPDHRLRVDVDEQAVGLVGDGADEIGDPVEVERADRAPLRREAPLRQRFGGADPLRLQVGTRLLRYAAVAVEEFVVVGRAERLAVDELQREVAGRDGGSARGAGRSRRRTNE